MSESRNPTSRDEVPLRDLMVGEPAVNRVLDGAAARARAEQLVREVSADPRLAEVVSRMERAATDDAGGHATVRERDPGASEVQRPTARLHSGEPADPQSEHVSHAAGQLTGHPAGQLVTPPTGQLTAPASQLPNPPPGQQSAQQTLPRLDPHARVTAPRLDKRDGGEHESAELHQAAMDEAFERARRDLGASANTSRADHSRLAILGATALAVGIILLALVLSRDVTSGDEPVPTAPTAQPGEIDVEVVSPQGTAAATAPAAVATPPGSVAAPQSTAVTPATPTAAQSVDPIAPSPDSAKPLRVETNLKSSAPKPPPSQDAPGPTTKPSSDRPF